MKIKKVLSNKQEYAAFIATNFKSFNLNTDLCDPSNLELNADQLFQLMEEVQKRVPEILSDLPDLPYIDISIQSSIEESVSIYLYSPYTSNAIIGFSTKLNSTKINLECVFERLDVRKKSITPDIQNDEFQPYLPGTIVILLVDDDKVVRTTLNRVLKQCNENLTIIEKHNGKEALEYIQSGSQCDLMLMDMQMPVMRGDVASKLIRNFECANNKINVPIIFMTAGSMVKEHLARSGINLALKKPFSVSTVYEALRRVKSIASLIPAQKINAVANSDEIFTISIPTEQEDLFVMIPNVTNTPTEQLNCISTDEDTFVFESKPEMSKNAENNELGAQEKEEVEVDEESGSRLTP
ncbi:MAG: response regulator [Gammaproteobacteria bacterium]|nr:response regulator [Gammaproteobacteria bacterium]